MYFCWPQALVALLVSPVMMIGGWCGQKVQKKLQNLSNDKAKEGDLLCGDAIVNYKTTQSFGNNQMVVKKYIEFMEPVFKANNWAHFKTGMSYGFSNFGMYLVFSVMFYAGGLIQENFKGEFNGTDIFISLFAIFFGASNAANAFSAAPDIGKARAAAERIFKIIDYPSKIDACALDENSAKIRIKSVEDIKGKVEFQNVWFRYPTRKEDFVLKGLNLTIQPNEQVALVGESGCGKSTFVNLLMRFYDVDQGAILLDNVNIKDYNLHDLRSAISLVMQEPIIFNYNILENILYGKLDATNTEVLEACEISNAREFIEKENSL